MAESPCPLCGTGANEVWLAASGIIRYTCPRCGEYAFLVAGQDTLHRKLEDSKIADPEKTLALYVGAYVKRRNKAGETPLLTTENWQRFAEVHAHTTPTQRARNLLALLGERSAPGREALIDPDTDAPLIEAIGGQEVRYYLQYLIESGWISPRSTHEGGYPLTIAGWQSLDPAPGGIPGRCFVAMAFDPSLEAAFGEGIEPGIRDCGLEPIRVDRQHYNDKVDDQIVVEIRRAEFTVADVTRQRPGVYFEAGLAIGLGRPVIWTCCEDDLTNVHFDTRQYNHVVWSAPADLREKLSNRIRATIPSAQARLTRGAQ